MPATQSKRRPSKRRHTTSRAHTPLTNAKTPSLSAVESAAHTRSGRAVTGAIVVLVALAGLLVFVLVGYLVLSNTAAFTITAIDTEGTVHLSAETIARQASVREGTTLLNIDENAIAENLKRNPWVKSVSFEKEFPDRLKIVVKERKVDLLVEMSAGTVCWYLGDDNVWIEPYSIDTSSGKSSNSMALAKAQELGALLITDLPSSVSPAKGSQASDAELAAIRSYREQFSKDFGSRISCFSAQSVESISCTLSNGVEVSLGSPTSIDIKESIITKILVEHPNQITYINVRNPYQPAYRLVGTESVGEGTGIVSTSNTEEQAAETVDTSAGVTASQSAETEDMSLEEGSDPQA